MNRLLVVLCFGGAAAWAQTAEPAHPSITVETSVMSRYLWRGMVLNDSPSLQPAVTIKYQGFTLLNWSNFSRTVPNHQAWTEHDLFLDYSREVGRFRVSAGFVEYWYPDQTGAEGSHTTELALGVAYVNYLNPAVKVYRDISSGGGYYHTLGFSHAYSWRHGVALTPSATLGLNQHLYQPATTISDLDLGLTLDIPAGRMMISPLCMLMTGNRSLYGTHSAIGVKISYAR